MAFPVFERGGFVFWMGVLAWFYRDENDGFMAVDEEVICRLGRNQTQQLSFVG